MALFNKDIFLNNTYYLAKESKVKISELESFAGVSAGYISRLRKESNKVVPSIEFVLSIANRLQVNVDTLLNYSLNSKTSTEVLIIKFIDALIRKTNEEELVWNSEDAQDLSVVYNDEYDYPSCHTISQLDLYNGNHKAYYESPYHLGEEVKPVDRFYNVKINNNKVYFVKYHVPAEDGSYPHSEPNVECDLLMFNDGNIEKLAHQNIYNESDVFYKKMDELFWTIYDSSSRTHLSKSAKETINSFLDVDDLPF